MRSRRWLNGGAPPAHQPRLAREGEPPELPRDEHGNATGGIRLPDLEAPLGTHVGQSPRDGFVQLMGTSTPFPPEKVRALYPDQATWFAAVPRRRPNASSRPACSSPTTPKR